jgi:transposase-like protein
LNRGIDVQKAITNIAQAKRRIRNLEESEFGWRKLDAELKERVKELDASEVRTQETKGFMQQVRVASRRKCTQEENVRIVLEGFRREVGVKDLCRREGIKPGAYYAWTKDFMEAGKERPTRDAAKDATRQEIDELKLRGGASA